MNTRQKIMSVFAAFMICILFSNISFAKTLMYKYTDTEKEIDSEAKTAKTEFI